MKYYFLYITIFTLTFKIIKIKMGMNLKTHRL